MLNHSSLSKHGESNKMKNERVASDPVHPRDGTTRDSKVKEF